MIASQAFCSAYREAVAVVANDADLCFRLPASPDLLSLSGYLSACEALYVEVLRTVSRPSGAGRPAGVLDAGGSFGAFATALRSLGLPVVEGPVAEDRVDLVVGLALHGHTASAPEIASQSGRLLRRDARLVLVVPSSGYWPSRLAELRKRAVPAPDDGVVQLGTPSYTRRELSELLRAGGWHLAGLRAGDYSPAGLGGPLRQIIGGLATRVAPRHREVWLALASRKSET